MAEQIANFSSDVRDKESDETIREYYLDLRDPALAESSKEQFTSAWNRLYEFTNSYYDDVESNDSDDCQITKFGSVNREVVIRFIHWLREQDEITKESTVENHIQELRTMVNWFNTNGGIMKGNPFESATDTDPFGDTTPSPKIEVPIQELKNGLADVVSPTVLYIVTMLLSTGLRISELSNIDERDVYLSHPIEDSIDNSRPELTGKPDSIYVDSSITDGEIVNGEERSDPNKKNSSRVIPLTNDAKQVLIYYLTIRQLPDSPANPILVKSSRGPTPMGTRLSSAGIRKKFNSWSDDNGWYSADTNSVKPHWCRHFFTTTLRSNLDDDDVEVGSKDDYENYIRGDQSSDSKDDYIQMSWGKNRWMHDVLDDSLPDLLD